MFTLAAPKHRMADLARLDELRRLHAEHPRRYFAPLASALRRSGDPRAAVEVLRPGLAAQPEHLTGHVILGQALADAGDDAGARAAYEHAHRVDEGNVVALGALVRLARAAGDDAAAARWTALLAEADPEPEGARPSADAPPVDVPDAEAPVSAFELLDYDEIATPHAVPNGTPDDVPGRAAHEPLDPVVGLDEAPADPLPAPMRQALPELLDDAPEPAEDAAGRDHGAFDEPAAAPPAAPFVTETMAGLLAAQGHTAQALEVYAQLLAQRPNDARLLAQVTALRGGAPAAEAPADPAPPAEAAAAAAPNALPEAPPSSGAADERSARMWRAAFAPVPDDVAPADVAPAAAAPVEVPAAEASVDDLSFDRFFEAFGDEPDPAPPEPAGDFERWADGVEAAAAVASAEAAPAPLAVAADDPAARAAGDDPDADLAAFNRWLRGLDA